MTEQEPFDQFVSNVARGSWEVFRRDALLFVVASVVLFLVAVVTLGLLAGPVTIGFIEMVRRSKAGEPLAISMLFSRFDTFVPSLVAGVLVSIAAFIGMMLLVIPGLLVILFASWAFHVIAYEKASGIEALHDSYTLVKNSFVNTVALLLLVSIAHTIGGAVVFGVLVTTPLSLIAMTLGYERLTGGGARVDEALTI